LIIISEILDYYIIDQGNKLYKWRSEDEANRAFDEAKLNESLKR
jgi:hypothetical protein